MKKLDKQDYTFQKVQNHIKKYIQDHKKTTWIKDFDHYGWTDSIDGKINDDILEAYCMIFCLGRKLTDIDEFVNKPKSIGVIEKLDGIYLVREEYEKKKVNSFIKDMVESL